MTKSLVVMISNTGSPVAFLTASEYADISVHSNKNALRFGFLFTAVVTFGFRETTSPRATEDMLKSILSIVFLTSANKLR